jgi:hypothetical protein
MHSSSKNTTFLSVVEPRVACPDLLLHSICSFFIEWVLITERQENDFRLFGCPDWMSLIVIESS